MAIDQEIAQRVDAYRGNPQVLQQRYAANQELLDLLALQRLKSEKDDAMRKVQLEMQQDPQTIKQQKERQLLEMTKQDLTNQTAGIMQNTQKKQKKNMQRVAKRGSVSPQHNINSNRHPNKLLCVWRQVVLLRFRKLDL